MESMDGGDDRETTRPRAVIAPLALATAMMAMACGDDGGRPGGGGTGVASLDDGIELDTVGADETMGVFDVGDGETAGQGGDCPGGGGMMGEPEFSYIWIANSTEGTVSKIDTYTGIELGRYRTGPGDPDPSRTSVNQRGDVAVANRNGGITKISAVEERCVDANGDGQIQTSHGPGEILGWGEDECVLWYQDLPATGGNGPRPIAWEPLQDACGAGSPRVWVGFYTGIDSDIGIFQRRDGATGELLDEVEVPVWHLTDRDRGPYGGAVNKEGDFWVTGYYGPAIRIDAETLDVEWFEPPAGSGFYGMALDQNEDIWIGGCDGAIYRFSQDTQDFTTVATIQGRARGVQIDDQGRAWFAGNNPCRLMMVDTNTGTLVEDAIQLPGCGDPVGVSIDVEGNVWVVDREAQQAYKVDPDSHAVLQTVTGLVDPYTYSDMTGHGLNLVTNPPAG